MASNTNQKSAAKAPVAKHVGSVDTLESLTMKLAELLEAEKKKMDAWNKATLVLDISQLADPIMLNVGGQMFATSLETLNRLPGSYFAALVSGRWELKRSKYDGSIFIDRNPTAFGYLLEYMRDPNDFHNIYPHLSALERHHLKKDCEFYMMPEVLASVVPLSSASWSELRSLIGFKSLRLLYQWSNDGVGASIFHEKCDSKGPTLVVCCLADGRIAGGFTSVDWAGPDAYKPDPTALLFSIKSGETTVNALRQTGNEPECAVRCLPTHGPTFGSGIDMQFSLGRPLTLSFGSSKVYASHGIANGTPLKDLFILSVEL